MQTTAKKTPEYTAMLAHCAFCDRTFGDPEEAVDFSYFENRVRTHVAATHGIHALGTELNKLLVIEYK